MPRPVHLIYDKGDDEVHVPPRSPSNKKTSKKSKRKSQRHTSKPGASSHNASTTATVPKSAKIDPNMAKAEILKLSNPMPVPPRPFGASSPTNSSNQISRLKKEQDNMLQLTPSSEAPGVARQAVSPLMGRRAAPEPLQRANIDESPGQQVLDAVVYNEADDARSSSDMIARVTQQLTTNIEGRIRMELESQMNPEVVEAISVEKAQEDLTICGFPRQRFCMLSLLTVAIVAGVLVVVFTTRKTPQSSPTGAPTVSVTLVPSLSRLEYLKEMLGPNIAPNNSTDEWALLEGPQTPQALALAWLSEVDEYSSRPEMMETQVLLERYALAVFHYSMSPSLPFFLNATASVCRWKDDMTYNGVSCSDPNNYRSVTHITLSGLALEGTVPWELSFLEHLGYMSLSENSFSGTLPTELGSLAELTSLYLTSNSLSGSVPKLLPPSLQDLGLENNQFTGTLCSAWATTAPKLRFLFLESNHFHGSIPSEIGNMDQLVNIDLQGNGISGSIPSTLGALSNLQFLYLEENALTGTLPTQLGTLWNLFIFHVNDNPAISGTVPSEFQSLQHLEEIWLENTSLTGSVEYALCASSYGLTVYADCLGENPELQCSCCSYCCSSDGKRCESDSPLLL